MLTFKQFKSKILNEAGINDFVNIPKDEFNETNPEHMDVINAYNKFGKNKVDNHPSRFSSRRELENFLYPYVEKVRDKRIYKEIHDKEDKDAFDNGEVELVHNDPDAGFKIYRARTENGVRAVSRGCGWCISSEDNEQNREVNHFTRHDPLGKDTFILHFDKEPGTLKRVGISGISHATNPDATRDEGFRKKKNEQIDPDEWEHLVHKYDLQNVPHLTGMIGLPFNQNFVNIKYAKDSDELKQKLKSSKYFDDDLDDLIGHAYDHDYLNDTHRKLASDKLFDTMKNGWFSNEDKRNAEKYEYWEPRHQKLWDAENET